MAIDMGIARGRQAARVRLPALAVVAVVVLAGLGAWSAAGGTGGYTSADRDHFISGCTQNGGATRSQCECMFARISARLSHSAYEKAADKDWSLQTSRAFTDAVSACSGGPEPAAISS